MPRRLALAALAAMAATALLPVKGSPAQASSVPAFDHVFVIVMENHSYSAIIGSAAAPYLNSLVPAGGLATKYYATRHPSLPNYLAMAGGSTFGITSDCTTCWVGATNIADTLEAAGSSWKAYMESMPSACFVGDSYPYVQKHNPFIYFNDIRTNATRCKAHVLPFTQMAADLKSTATTPNYAFISPNMCNDTHDCSIGTGDSWLKQQVPAILASPAFKTQHSLLAVLWDEDDSSGTNQVPLVFLGQGVGAGYKSAATYNHYSMLHTIEAARSLPTLTANDAGAAIMSDLFTSTAPAHCATASLSPAAPVSPAGSTVIVTATSTACPSPRYEYWVQYPNATWHLAQGWGGNTFTWNTAGLVPGTYAVHAWANQAGDSTATYEGMGSGIVTLTGCTSATTTPASGSSSVGASVTFTTSSRGCPNPVYEYWLQWVDGTWHRMTSFGGPTWTWNTASGYSKGTYHVHAWANQQGAYTGAFETFGSSTYTLS
jgi:phosphatidylinositol-3-phosphatase